MTLKVIRQTQPKPETQSVTPKLAGSAATWLVAVIATPVVLAGWSPLWFIALWVVAHTIAYWGYVISMGRPTATHLWRVLRLGSSLLIWGAIPISAVAYDGYAENEPQILLMTFAFVSLRAIVLPDDRRVWWDIDGLIVGLVVACCSLLYGLPAFGVAAATGAVFYMLVERHQLAMHEQAFRDRQAAQQAIEQLTSLAHTDQLTGLGNRRASIDWLASAQTGAGYALLFDVDHFKQVNDNYGHSVGDQLLVALAAVSQRRLGPEWTVFRLGGDEFVAFTTSSTPPDPTVFDNLRLPVTSHNGVRRNLNVFVSGAALRTSLPTKLDPVMSRAGRYLRDAKSQSGSKLTGPDFAPPVIVTDLLEPDRTNA